MNEDRTLNVSPLQRAQPSTSFGRLHKPFHDAVRTGNKSAVVDVLLRAQLSGDQARRTAEKILADLPESQ